MRFTRRQMRMLTRYTRATRVWSRAGVRLAPSTRVVVEGNQVRVVRTANSNSNQR